MCLSEGHRFPCWVVRGDLGRGQLGYTYNVEGSATEVRLNGVVLAQPVFDGAGRMSSVSYPAAGAGNGTSGVFSIDAFGQQSGVSWTGPGGSLFSQQVSRRVDGNIVDETVDGVDAQSGANFVYDAVGRLTDARVRGTAGTHLEVPRVDGHRSCGEFGRPRKEFRTPAPHPAEFGQRVVALAQMRGESAALEGRRGRLVTGSRWQRGCSWLGTAVPTVAFGLGISGS